MLLLFRKNQGKALMPGQTPMLFRPWRRAVFCKSVTHYPQKQKLLLNSSSRHLHLKGSARDYILARRNRGAIDIWTLLIAHEFHSNTLLERAGWSVHGGWEWRFTWLLVFTKVLNLSNAETIFVQSTRMQDS